MLKLDTEEEEEEEDSLGRCLFTIIRNTTKKTERLTNAQSKHTVAANPIN